jgi:hypothetical protein
MTPRSTLYYVAWDASIVTNLSKQCGCTLEAWMVDQS